MSTYVKVKKEEAEKKRRQMISKKVYDNTRRVEKDSEYVYIPIKKKVKCFELVDKKGEKIIKKPKSLQEACQKILSKKEMEFLPTSFDIIGDIAIIQLPQEIINRKKDIAGKILETFTHIKTVALKSSAISTRYRTRKIKIIAGEEKTKTRHKEHGCIYELDVQDAYFSPRSGHERQRVINQIKDDEEVLVLFAGVGPFAILAAKKTGAKVVAVELNHKAVQYMEKNVFLNKVNVKIVEGDAKLETPKLGLFDRIIMPLPKDASDFLEVSFNCLKKNGVIHYYTFKHDLKEAEEEIEKISSSLDQKIEILESVYCGSYSPCLSRICVDVRKI